MRYPRLIPLLLALFAGCAEVTGADPSAVLLSTDQASYRQGLTVSVSLSNQSGSPVGFNPCRAEGERWTGDSWQRISPLRLCTEDLDRVAPGATAAFPEPVSREWEAGLYRIVVPVVFLDRSERVEIFTETFRIEP